MEIENMTSNRGNKIANQFKLYYNNYVAFQSYQTLISVYDIKNGEWYTEQTYISCVQSHKVYTFDEYGKVYHVLYIHGVYRLVDDENGEQYESSDIKDFERLLLNVVY